MRDFKKSCVYQIYPKSFCDTSGSGMGDLKGITAKLDYLKDLGIDYIWCTPFYASPQRDNGYDVSNYLSVDPAYGTMADLEELIAEAGKREIGLMLDMVFNHTSTEHEWFQRALAGDDKYKQYYIVKSGRADGRPPTNWVSKFGGNAWEYVPAWEAYYLHLFDRTQADLNWENPEVREEIKKVLQFWIKKGVRGFRFDVINLIAKPARYEDDHKGDGRRFYTDGAKVHEYLKEISADCGFYENGLLTVGEMSSTSLGNCIRYSDPEEKELNMCFNFHHLKTDYKDGDKWALQDCDFEELKKIFHTWQMGMQQANGWNSVFWCNHDQPRIISRFGDQTEYYQESAKMLAGMIHLMRGTPYIYQGEEIGMTNAGFGSLEEYRDVESINYYHILKEQGMKEQEILHILGARSRDNARTPMQWNSEAYGGFSKNRPWIDVNRNYKKINVQENLQSPDSIWYFYQQLIRMRKEYDVISHGAYEPLYEEHPDVFAYRRVYDEEELLVLANFHGHDTRLILEQEETGNYSCVLSNYKKRDLEKILEMKPYELIAWYTGADQ